MESGLPAIRAGIADPAHHLVDRGQTGGRRGPGKWVPPRFLARPVPGVGVDPIAVVAVVRALGDSALLGQSAERPALQGTVSGAGGLQGQLGIDAVSNQLTAPLYHFSQYGRARARVMPDVRGRNAFGPTALLER